MVLIKVQFVASTNPGVHETPIGKIASGGELSCFMLALRVALLDNNYKQTLICDEIDVGISGAISYAIGNRLKNLSIRTQVIVITYQPQVAGKADQHILVYKTQHQSETDMDVFILNEKGKSQELARMISGKAITKASFIAAKELM